MILGKMGLVMSAECRAKLREETEMGSEDTRLGGLAIIFNCSEWRVRDRVIYQ